MKRYAIALFLFTLCTTAKATFCVDRIYQEEKVNLYLCQNHTCFNETRSLLFKARTKVLNDYIKDKITKGVLRDKRFEIQINEFVVQNMQTIQSTAIDKLWKDTSEDFDIHVFPKWVNICYGGKENWIYSYSYDKNKFYEKNGI